jgi:hypothetical protein
MALKISWRYFSSRTISQMKIFMKIRPVFPCGRTDGQTWRSYCSLFRQIFAKMFLKMGNVTGTGQWRRYVCVCFKLQCRRRRNR